MIQYTLRDERNRNALIEHIAKLSLKRPWTVKIALFVKKRTNPQLALYWKRLHVIADITGNEAEDLHDIFKRKFIAPDVIDLGGESYARWTTGKLSTKEMSEFMEKVSAFASIELGIMLPAPEDLHERAA